MKRCIRCNNELTGRQRKFCSTKCSRQKEVAKYRKEVKERPVEKERRQKVKDYAAGKIELTQEEKQSLWWDIDSYRILFN